MSLGPFLFLALLYVGFDIKLYILLILLLLHLSILGIIYELPFLIHGDFTLLPFPILVKLYQLG